MAIQLHIVKKGNLARLTNAAGTLFSYTGIEVFRKPGCIKVKPLTTPKKISFHFNANDFQDIVDIPWSDLQIDGSVGFTTIADLETALQTLVEEDTDGGSGGGGSAALTTGFIGYGDGANTLTGSDDLIFDAATKRFIIKSLIGQPSAIGVDASGAVIALEPKDYGRIAGLDVIWTGGLTFFVSPGSYFIDGLLYTWPGGSITLSAADPDNPRRDTIAMDNSQAAPTGTLIKITGVAAADPAEPDLDTTTQIRLTVVSIAAGATEPDIITDIMIYDENLGTAGGEYDLTTSAAAPTYNANSTSHPLGGSAKNLAVTVWAANRYFNFKAGGVFNVSDVESLIIPVYLVGALGANRNLNISLLNGNTVVTNVIQATTRGLTRTTIAAYQYIVIPISAFTFTNTNIDTVRIAMVGTNGTINLVFDKIRWQLGVGGVSSQNAITSIMDGGGPAGVFTAQTPNAMLKVVGAGGATTSIVGNVLTITQNSPLPFGPVLVVSVGSSAVSPFGNSPFNYTVLNGSTSNIVVNAPSGSPSDGRVFEFLLKDNGVSRTISWNAIYSNFIAAALPAATVAGKAMSFKFVYGIIAAKWTLVSYQVQP